MLFEPHGAQRRLDSCQAKIIKNDDVTARDGERFNATMNNRRACPEVVHLVRFRRIISDIADYYTVFNFDSSIAI